MKSIMYHYVRQYDKSMPYLNFLNIKSFEKQIVYFKKKYKFFDCNNFDYFTGYEKIKDKIFLTFDDGLSCHYDYVFKILKKNKINGIFYIPTKPLIDERLLLPHKIHLILAKYGGKKSFNVLMSLINNKMLDQNKIKKFFNSTYKNQKNIFYVNYFKRTINYYLKKKHKTQIVNKIFKILFDNNEKKIVKDFYLSENQIKKMSKEGMVIGSHSNSHPLMSEMTKIEINKEIDISFDYLSQFFQEKTYCHPYGGFKSFNDYTEKYLNKKKVVFSMNVLSKDISNNQIIKRPQALPRYDCNMFPFGHIDKTKND